jgi:RimJ/RimL family protein N-acetyltransferase
LKHSLSISRSSNQNPEATTPAVLEIPELSTTRLLLRGFRQSDLDAYADIMTDPEVTRYIGDGNAVSRADAWRQMAVFVGHWVLRGFGIWVVEERATGTLVGRIGFWQPEGWPGFELAYTLGRPYWGRGFATEGARAVLTYGRETLGRKEIISLIRPPNSSSIRVAEALGAKNTGTIELLGEPAFLYRYQP